MEEKKFTKKMLREILHEWNWIFKYIIRYKFTILLYILLSLVAMGMSLGSSVAVKYLIDVVISHSNTEIVKYAALVIGLSLLNFLISAGSSWITANVGTKTNNEMRSEIYDKMISAHWEDIKKYHSGDLLNRIEGDVSTVSSGIINFIPSLFTNFLQFFGSLAIVLYYDKTMAILSLMSAPLLFLSSRYLMGRIRTFNRESREINGRVLSYSAESMQNIQFLKAFDLTDKYITNFRELLNEYRNVKLRFEKFSIITTLALSVIGLIVSYSCYGWGVYRLWMGAITYGTMTLFLQITGKLTSSFGALASMVPSVISIATSAGRIMEITEYKQENDTESERAQRILKVTKKKGVSLVADNISFTYKDGDNTVLSQISFEAHPGETIGFIGQSGEGKSTLLKLLLGLMEPDSGKLYLQYKNHSLGISDSTRRFYSYVPQELGIFSGTVTENLRMGNYEATEEEMIAALKQADAWDFVSQLPDGIYTPISEQANNISHGQAQRISIARALLRDSRILLLDEATSALDGETEAKVLSNIMVTDPNKICIITTHRESMLQYCDKIYKIEPNGTLSVIKES